ncbi:MAG: hypothetical protein ACRC0A_07695 [Chitinophagaceae bacterium]
MGIFLDKLNQLDEMELIELLSFIDIKIKNRNTAGFYVCSCFSGDEDCFKVSRVVFYPNTGSIICHKHGTKSLYEIIKDITLENPMRLFDDQIKKTDKPIKKIEPIAVIQKKEIQGLDQSLLIKIKDSTKKNKNLLYSELAKRNFSINEIDVLFEHKLIFYIDNNIKDFISQAPKQDGYNLCIPSFNSYGAICGFEFYAGFYKSKNNDKKYLMGKGGKNTFFDIELNINAHKKTLFCIEGFFDSLRFVSNYFLEFGCLPYAIATITAMKDVTTLNTYQDAEEIFLLFDQDTAGLMGAIKNIDLIDKNKKVYFNTYPKEQGKGIDELLQKNSINYLFDIITGISL